jgi:hypothetical protein
MSNSNNAAPGGPPPRLLAALEKVLRPLVRLMLSYQITYPQLIGMLKSLYVEVAEKEFQVPGKRQSDSRINLLTGVHRKDVKRLRAEDREPSTMPAAASIGAQIIARWMGDQDYTDADGQPRPLPVRSPDSSGLDFEGLVQQVCKQDIRPRVILDEWLRLDVAHIEDDCVVLNTGAFTPSQGFDEKVFFFGKNIQDHIAAGAHNLLGGKPSYFDRSVYYDKLSEQSVQALGELANTLGMQALTAMNKAAMQYQQDDQEQGRTSNYRINFGVFNYNAEVASDKHQEDDGSS